jgi:hypothetical protein
MLTVHKMPLKNQFLTGINSGHDKPPNQNEPQPFTSLSFTNDCTVDFLDKESCCRVTSTFTGTGILNNTSIKPDAGMIHFDGDFDPIRFYFEMETAKNYKLMMIFTRYAKFKKTL